MPTGPGSARPILGPLGLFPSSPCIRKLEGTSLPTLLKRVGNLISNTHADAQRRPSTTFAHLMMAPQPSSHGAWARSVLPALADAPAWSVLPGPGAPTLPVSAACFPG